jgi:hypothetical protein
MCLDIIMVLVGLMGIKGSGKTTGAMYLLKTYGFVEKSFAEPLKKACKELFLLDDIQVFGTQEQKEIPDPRWFNCTPRKMMQYVGTELLRDQLEIIMPELGKDVFTHCFKLWYEAEMKKNHNLCVVISDVRFQNEADFIQSLGGIVIKINRPSLQTNDIHQSEIELQNITTHNFLIENTGTIENFYSELDYHIKTLIGIKHQTVLTWFMNKIKFW